MELDNKNSLIMYMYILSNISINILYAPFYRFPLLLTRRICLWQSKLVSFVIISSILLILNDVAVLL